MGSRCASSGRLDEAAAVFRQFEKIRLSRQWDWRSPTDEWASAPTALGVIHAFEARARRQWVDPDFIAIAYAGIGDADHAMQWLETAFREKTCGVRCFHELGHAVARELRSDPRFVDLKRRVLATTFSS